MMIQDLEAVTWRCVHYAAAKETAVIPNGMTPTGIFVTRVRLESPFDKAALLEGLKTVFNCPDYVGSNWDALEEAMGDLDWLPALGYAVIIEGATRLWSNHPHDAGMLVEVALSCAESWSTSGQQFHLIFEMK